MTGRPRFWLPPAKVGEVEAALSRLAETWLKRWLVDPGAPACSRRPSINGKAPPIDEGRVIVNADLSALARAACASRAEPGNGRDSAVVDALAQHMLRDFLDQLPRLNDCAFVPAASAASRLTLFRLKDAAQGWTIELQLDELQLVAVRRSAAGSSKRSAPEAVRKAVSSEKATLGCHLGVARLSAAEAASLAQGDLLVLDSKHTDPLAITVAGRRCSAGRARISTDHAAVAVKVEQPIDFAFDIGQNHG